MCAGTKCWWRDQRNWEEVFWKLRVEQKRKCHLPLLVPEVRASKATHASAKQKKLL